MTARLELLPLDAPSRTFHRENCLPVSQRGWLIDVTLGRWWDALLVFWRGKRVAVLGARGVGKSHFIQFLSTGDIPVEYKQTLAPEKAGGRRLQLGELDLKIGKMLDVGGGTEARAQWRKQVEAADFVFYLLRADQVLAGDLLVEERVIADGKHMKDWLKDRSPRPKVCIVGTHGDLDSSFRGQFDNHHGDYVRRFREHAVVHKLVMLCGGTGQASLVVGSMKTLQATEDLVLDVFRHITVTE